MVTPDLTTVVAGIEFKNPILTASGTFGYGLEFTDFLDLKRLGGLVTKGLSAAPRRGNPPARVVETPAGMLNAIGLQNIGVPAFLEDKLPKLRKYDTKVIANVFGATETAYVAACEMLDGQDGIAGIELNVSCPNTEEGGMIFGIDPASLGHVTALCRKTTTLPLIVKLSPNVTDIQLMARSARDAGADAISLVNTFVGMAVDVERRRPVLANVCGGLSGPAIRPLAVWLTWQVRQAVEIPIIGIGGIMSARDVVEFLLVGASAVQVGTASFVTPSASADIVTELQGWLAERDIGSVRELIGGLQVPPRG
jgi:dihydroorotate dehydrogenase (NAD+) catalytic subunit